MFHGVMDLREHRRLFTEEFMRRGQAMAGNLAYSGELGVFAEDRQLLESSMRGVAGDPDVAYVVIYGEDGKILAQRAGKDSALEGRTWELSVEEKGRLLLERRPMSKAAGHFVEFLAPIQTEAAKSPEETLLGRLPKGPGAQPEKRVIGVVRLGLSLSGIEHRMGGLVRLWAGVTIIFFILSTIAVYFFSRRVTGPVKRLTEHAQRMGRGFLEETVPVETRDEVGQLAGTLNDMAHALKGNIRDKERILAELQDLNRTLEDRIRERTAELEERSEALQRSLDEVRAMGEISSAVSSSLDLTEVLDAVSASAVRLSGSDACGIYEVVRNTFTVVATHNLSREFVRAIEGADPRQGALSRAAEMGQPVQFPDLAAAEDFALRNIILREGLRALLAVPMGSGGVLRGIVLYRRQAGPFDERAVRLLTTLANQSKVAIENARLFHEVRSQRVRLETLSRNMEQLYRLSTAMQEPLSLRDQLARVLEAARQVVRIDRFYIWVVSPAGDHVAALVGAGFSEAEREEFVGVEIPLADAGAMAEAYRTGVPLAFDEEHPVPPELRLAPPYSERRGLRSKAFLVVPMIARGRVVGLLTADNKVGREPVPAQTAVFYLGQAHSPVRPLPEAALCLSRFELDARLARQFRELGGELREGERWRETEAEDGVVSTRSGGRFAIARARERVGDHRYLDAGSGHRGQRRHLQPCSRRVAASARQPRRGSPDLYSPECHGPRHSERRLFRPRNHRPQSRRKVDQLLRRFLYHRLHHARPWGAARSKGRRG